MKLLGLYLLKYYIRLGLFFYFKKIVVSGIENIPKNKPVLLLSNHQNALLDALLIATSIKGYAHYLTRAGVFKNSFVSGLLRRIQLIPVYRIRDGYGNLINNNEIFETAADLLNNGNVVTIFPEGSHDLVRRVRPLSKGFTRIVFKVLDHDPESDLQLLPIGVNFTDAKVCPDSTAIYFGKSIAAMKYKKDDRNKAVVELKREMHQAISQLTTHIPEDRYDRTLAELNSINVNFLNPIAVNKCIETRFKSCEAKPKSRMNWLREVLQFLLKLNLWLPYGVWKLVVQPKIQEVEFTSTFRFAIAITLVPFFLIGIALLLTIAFSYKIALLYIIGTLLLALLTIKI